MAMRMSGLISGMDTESLIGQLVEARSAKVNKAKKSQTKLEWKQDAWKELNTKLKNLQSRFVSNMRFSTAYSKKVTKVSNPNAVSVITGDGAVNGVQSLEINKLAKTAYLTGAELKTTDANGQEVRGNYTALTTLGELGVRGNGSFTVNSGGQNVDISVNERTTISDVLTKLKEAGLNANFDARSQRFFVSAKESGKAADFSITASNTVGLDALGALGLQTEITEDTDAATWNRYKALTVNENGRYRAKTASELGNELTNAQQAKADSYLERYKALETSIANANRQNADIDIQLNGTDGVSGINGRIATLQAERVGLTGDELDAKDQEIAALTTERDNLVAAKVSASSIQEMVDERDGITGTYITLQTDNGEITGATPKTQLERDVEADYAIKTAFAARVLNGDETVNAGAKKIAGEDAKITLNGAEFTNSTNSFEINGLTFTALAETRAGESITVTTEQDTDGIYDMVKNFLKEYNAIINEMDKLYNAESAKGYEPLTDDEKKAMSDSEAEKYEKKIKDALLRRDSNLSDISSGLREVMSSGISVGGKTMHLFDFGIDMLGYFNAADNEKNAYHIDGDPDDADTSGNADKLKSMIASDPDTVISFFTQLSQNLYDKMTDMSRSQDGYRSFGSFYDDKKMKSDYEDYKSKIATMEEKLNKYEDSWYKKFAKMETAMAKMQKNANSLAGLLGGGS